MTFQILLLILQQIILEKQINTHLYEHLNVTQKKIVIAYFIIYANIFGVDDGHKQSLCRFILSHFFFTELTL